MIRLSPILVVPTSWIVCCALLLPVAAQAECLQWDMSGRWEIVQGNGYNATFDLTQSGNELHGTGRYSEARSRSIDGSVGENGFDFTVHWSNGAIGYYAGDSVRMVGSQAKAPTLTTRPILAAGSIGTLPAARRSA